MLPQTQQLQLAVAPINDLTAMLTSTTEISSATANMNKIATNSKRSELTGSDYGRVECD
jgi:hypothetical protein